MEQAEETYDDRSSLRGAIVATMAFVLTFAAAAAPIPLYTHFQQTVGISDTEVSLTIVFYLVGVLTVLFFAGSVSDAVGRRPLAAASLLLGALGCLMFTNIANGLTLQLARLVQGVACGLTMSATSAFVIDSAGTRYRTLGVTVASCGSLLGITAGSLGIGLFSGISSNYNIVFYVLTVLSLVTAVLLPLVQETVTDRITLRKAIRPIVTVPKKLRPVFPIAAGAYIATWGIGMFFQSLSTPAAVQYFGTEGPLVPALILAMAMAPSAAGGPLESRLSTETSIRVGMLTFFGSCVGLTIALQMQLLGVFLLLECAFSLSMGICLSVGMRLLIESSSPGENAAIVSLINFAGYVGSTIMSLMMSWMAGIVPLSGVLGFLTVLGLMAVVPGLAHAHMRSRRSRDVRTAD